MAGKIQNVDPIGNLTSILDMFNGKTTVDTIGGTTTTTKVDYSDAQLQDQMRAALGGVSGLASISSGERQAGMYNSTVRQQATNDLLSRIVTEATAKKVGQTVTTSGGQNTRSVEAPLGGGRATNPLLLAGLGSLLSPTVSRAKGKLGIDSLGTSIADTIFGSNVEALPAVMTPGNIGFMGPMPEVAGLAGEAATGAASEGGWLSSLAGGPAAPLIAAALYLDQNTKTSRLTDVAENVAADPLKAIGDAASGFMGGFDVNNTVKSLGDVFGFKF